MRKAANFHLLAILVVISLSTSARGEPIITEPLLQIGFGGLTVAAMSPDGKWLATGTRSGASLLWDVATEEIVHTFNLNAGRIAHLSFSPDSTMLLACGRGGTAVVWDVNEMSPIRTLSPAVEGILRNGGFAADGLQLVLVSDVSGVHSVSTWDIASGERVSIFETDYVMEISRDGRFVVSRTLETVTIHDTRDGRLVQSFPVEPDHNGAASFVNAGISGDGSTVVTVAQSQRLDTYHMDSTIEVRDVVSRETLGVFYIDDIDLINEVAISPDGSRVLTAFSTADIQDLFQTIVWDTSTGQPINTLEPDVSASQDHGILDSEFSSDASRVLAPCTDGTAYLWSVETGEIENRLSGHASSESRAVAFAPDSREFAVSTTTGIRFYAPDDRTSLHTIEWENFTTDIAFSPDGRSLVAAIASSSTAGPRGRVIRIDTESGATLQSFPIAVGSPFQVAYSPDSSRILYSSEGQQFGPTYSEIHIYDAASGESIGSVTTESLTGAAAAFLSDGNRFAIMTDLGTIQIVDTNTFAVVAQTTIPSHENPRFSFLSIDGSPDGGSFLAGGGDGNVYLIDSEDASIIQTYTGHPRNARSTAFHPSGAYVLAVNEGTIKVWNSSDGTPAATILTHARSISDFCVSPDGNYLVTTGMDAIKVWPLDFLTSGIVGWRDY